MSDYYSPNPGSQEAQQTGCTCPVIDNGYGNGCGRVDSNGNPQFWISEGCPLHDVFDKVLQPSAAKEDK